MSERTTHCPDCGSEKLTTVHLPRPTAPGEPPATRLAWRCLECDRQWPRERAASRA